MRLTKNFTLEEMTQNTYTMDVRGQVLRLIPTVEKQDIVKSEKGYTERSVKSYKEYDDGVIEITFREEKPKKAATIKNKSTIGNTTIKFSKDRINLLTKFAKTETDAAFTELLGNLPLIQAYVKSQLTA